MNALKLFGELQDMGIEIEPYVALLSETHSIYIMCGVMEDCLDERDIGYTLASACKEYSIAYESNGQLNIMQGYKNRESALLACLKAVQRV